MHCSAGCLSLTSSLPSQSSWQPRFCPSARCEALAQSQPCGGQGALNTSHSCKIQIFFFLIFYCYLPSCMPKAVCSKAALAGISPGVFSLTDDMRGRGGLGMRCTLSTACLGTVCTVCFLHFKAQKRGKVDSGHCSCPGTLVAQG